ncbi:MAG: hypothetical protein IPI07_06395 [Flavobacteriales bacterium]|nr:hypothetical protein [Flavobacteriales bacterium]MBK9074206.1 hypothetical protein [Flavobacteriales bacterium]
MNPRSLLFLALLGSAFLVTGCRKDLQFTEDGVTLEFSTEQVLFDTVFSQLTTSVTKRFVARNPNTQGVKVDIALVGGSPSPFRINVDGVSGETFEDVAIAGKDSVFIFVEVLPGATGVNTPFVIEDQIRFNTNGTEQEVLLQVWGQDVLKYPNADAPIQNIQGLPPFCYIAGGYDNNGVQICGENVVWTAEKPILLMNYAVVDSCNSLTIEAGARIYVHNGAGLWVYKYGRLTAAGEQEQKIIFQGDRLEPAYQGLPGQWDRIWINEGEAGADNTLENVIIRNALIGIQCETFPSDPLAPTSAAKLILNNVAIRNCSAAGILSRNYRITSNNLLVADAGQYCVALTGGGEYFFNHTTIANYWSFDVREEPAFIMTNTYGDINGNIQVRDITASTFQNGIIYGSNTNEFLVDVDEAATTDYFFNRFLFRTDQSTSDAIHFGDQSFIIRNQDPAFADANNADFHLTSSSISAINKGVISTNEAFSDLDGVFRGDGQPDLGCYEFE